jgi:hypothetical protein
MPSASHSDPATAEAMRARARADVARLLAAAGGLLRVVELAESLGPDAYGEPVPAGAPRTRTAPWRC